MITLSIILLLFSNAVCSRRDISILFNRVAIICLSYCILHDLMSLSLVNKGIGLHGGLLHITNITQIFHIFVYIISILILQLTSFYPRKVWISEYSSLNNLLFNQFIYYRTIVINKMGEQFKINEYPLILLFIIAGAVLLMSTNDLVSIFLAIELQSYGLYLLCSLYRNSELSTTGGLIYFLIGGLGSCFILFGSGLIYVNSGTTSLDALYVMNNLSDVESFSVWYKPYYTNISLIMFMVGFLIKIGAAPFHFWSPDVYDSVPTVVTTFVALIAKISIFILLLQFVYFFNSNLFDSSWTYSIIYCSFMSIIIGSIGGLTQLRIKRLLAYSTISHVGFLLLALGISSVESIQALLFYLTQYSISSLNMFVIILAIGYSFFYYVSSDPNYKELTDNNNSPIQLISQLRGFFFINPVLAISLAITLFSFVGVPPLVGFFGKQMVLSAALDRGYYFMALIAITTSVISAVYYLNVIKEIFFYPSEYMVNPTFKDLTVWGSIYDKDNFFIKDVNFNYSNVVISSTLAFTISTITLIILSFMFISKEWLSMGAILAYTLVIW
uniref:NADH-ubiquinone oxidoreductase chain 2 n=1 Tax=Endoconidiophora resinifera TaxID=1580851 RepID=A0A3G6XM81_9PEZI|nr:NADH dehydrogenase subunit 2 [Endoconidiophora resinifera]AZL93782.1 NADH dehydrogenase subunit 2 [Endoconidiophora resinifera]AZL93796.1 NADH dehydrogenase subunit 2 [Endoconidiophora resinifera]AZL93810.1 NADH dehydrogenase subunit 2 [Endoconidiophora resinifera]